MALDKDTIPQTIPDSRKKQALLCDGGISNIYLGQGLIFVPPERSVEPYNQLLIEQGMDTEGFPLSSIQKKGGAGEPYNSPTLDRVWGGIQEGAFKGDFRSPEAFGTFVREQARSTMMRLFEVDPDDISTIQVDNLMQALSCAQRAIPALMNDRPVSRIILPRQYKYSGHTEFVNGCKKIGIDMEIIEIPEVQIDGSQDLDAVKRACEQIRSEGRVAIIIDQESNNNASGFDRDVGLNQELSLLLKEYEDCVVYFGDIAYKGLKRDVVEPYPLMQQLIDNEVAALFYCSSSKTGNYRGTPSYKNTLMATPGGLGNTGKWRSAFGGIQREMGIGATGDGAILMNRLVNNPDFLREVRVLKTYLQYVRDGLYSALQDTGLESIFGKNTSGIFRCLPRDITTELNSGDKQVVTVGDRINIWPLGDPDVREFFVDVVLGAVEKIS